MSEESVEDEVDVNFLVNLRQILHSEFVTFESCLKRVTEPRKGEPPRIGNLTVIFIDFLFSTLFVFSFISHLIFRKMLRRPVTEPLCAEDNKAEAEVTYGERGYRDFFIR